MHAQVFARVSPDQKEAILRLLPGAGWTTLMCGDGTNDVGALKSADVGVALLAPAAGKPAGKKAAFAAGYQHQQQQQQAIIPAIGQSVPIGVASKVSLAALVMPFLRPPPSDGKSFVVQTTPVSFWLLACGSLFSGVASSQKDLFSDAWCIMQAERMYKTRAQKYSTKSFLLAVEQSMMACMQTLFLRLTDPCFCTRWVHEMPVRLHRRDAQEVEAWEDHAQPVGTPNDSSHMLEQDQVVGIAVVNGLAGQQAIKKTHDRNASGSKVWEGYAQPVGKPKDSSHAPEQDQVVVNGPAGQERERDITSIQPAWLMRTGLCSCLSLLQQGNEP